MPTDSPDFSCRIPYMLLLKILANIVEKLCSSAAICCGLKRLVARWLDVPCSRIRLDANSGHGAGACGRPWLCTFRPCRLEGLLATIRATGAEHIGVTHGYVSTLVRYLTEQGIDAFALPSRYEGDDVAEAEEALSEVEEGDSPLSVYSRKTHPPYLTRWPLARKRGDCHATIHGPVSSPG